MYIHMCIHVCVCVCIYIYIYVISSLSIGRRSAPQVVRGVCQGLAAEKHHRYHCIDYYNYCVNYDFRLS